MPVAVGAAVAAPGRKVISLNGDGAAMYTVQGLWTLARESLDVTVVVFANNTYRILGIELGRTGAGDAGPGGGAACSSLGDPAHRLGQPGQGPGRAGRALRDRRALRRRLRRAPWPSPGPKLIEVALA